jgi:hypothetical protein
VSAAFDLFTCLSTVHVLRPLPSRAAVSTYREFRGEPALWLVRGPRFTRLPDAPAPSKPEITAKPRGSHEASDWDRHIGALSRLAEGHGSLDEVQRDIAHDRQALGHVASPWPSAPAPRYRKERSKLEPKPPTFTPDELQRAAAMIDAKCRGFLIERAWIELRNPPGKCLPTDSLEVLAQRAIWRAERTVKEDACRFKYRAKSFDEWTFGPYINEESDT